MSFPAGAEARALRDDRLAANEVYLDRQRKRACDAIASAAALGAQRREKTEVAGENTSFQNRSRRPESKRRGSRRRTPAQDEPSLYSADTPSLPQVIPLSDEVVVLPKLAGLPDYHLYTSLTRCFSATEAAVQPQIYIDDTDVGQRRALMLTKHLYLDEVDDGYSSDRSFPTVEDLAEYSSSAGQNAEQHGGACFEKNLLDPGLSKQREALRYAVLQTVERHGETKEVVEGIAKGLNVSYALCCFILKSAQTRARSESVKRKDAAEGLASYMELFCRTCFRFDCRLHNIQHSLSASVAANKDRDFLAYSRKAWSGDSKGCAHPGLECHDPKSGCSCVKHDGAKDVKCTKFCSCFDLVTFPTWNCKNKRTYCNCNCDKNEALCKSNRCVCMVHGYFCDWDLCGCCFAERVESRTGRLPVHAKLRCSRIWDERRAAKSKTIVGKSQVHGWGLFSRQGIRQGDIVDEYLGEELDGEGIESQRREVWNRVVKRAYSFDKPDGDSGIVDGRFKGNRLRFINHLSAQDQKTYGLTSNCHPRCDWVDEEPRILVRASRTIEAGEELFMDYGDGHTFVESATDPHEKSNDAKGEDGATIGIVPVRPWDMPAPPKPVKNWKVEEVIDLT